MGENVNMPLRQQGILPACARAGELWEEGISELTSALSEWGWGRWSSQRRLWHLQTQVQIPALSPRSSVTWVGYFTSLNFNFPSLRLE